MCVHVLVIHSKVRRPQKERKKEREKGRRGEGAMFIGCGSPKSNEWWGYIKPSIHVKTCLGSRKNEKINDKAPQILPNQIPIDMLMSTQTTLPCKKRKNYHNPHTHHNIFLVPFSTSTHSHLLFHPQFPLSLPIHEKTLSTPTTIPTGNNI